jgi:hypothetical protein
MLPRMSPGGLDGGAALFCERYERFGGFCRGHQSAVRASGAPTPPMIAPAR